ncbi:MAG: hypothetical protein R3C17_14555 [Planctomycetaceae bacterium]
MKVDILPGMNNIPGHAGYSCRESFRKQWQIMARLARVEVFAADEIAIVHVTNRVVRRCFLLGNDPVTGKNFDHRKRWLDEQLIHQARHFGIDLLCQAILSNHFHLVLRSRPDVVAEWDDAEIARRWLMLCPERRDTNGKPTEEPSGLNSIISVKTNRN